MHIVQPDFHPNDLSQLLKSLYFDDMQIITVANYLVSLYAHCEEVVSTIVDYFSAATSPQIKLSLITLIHETIQLSMNDTSDFVDAFGKHMLTIAHNISWAKQRRKRQTADY